MKIGRYTEDEILEHLTEGEGRGFLGRSMYDAIFDKIHALITENEQLKKDKDFYANAFVNLRNRNDKAIEYIEKHRKTFSLGINEEIDEFDYISTSPKKLLKILKEENKEE